MKMIDVSTPTWLSLLLLFFTIFHKTDCWCTNGENSQPLSFENFLKINQEYTYTTLLIEGYQLEISCCVVSTSPSVSWLFNGKPINEYGDLFVLSEKGQILQSANKALIDNRVLEGVYNCTAVEGNETLSAAFIIKRISKSNQICSQGKTTDIKLGQPPSSLYQVAPGSSLTLECTVLLTCHVRDSYEEIYWEKYYMKYAANTTKPKNDEFEDLNREAAYLLSATNPYDSQTGNYVNVTTKMLNNSQMLVTTTLHILNITDEDLHDPNNPDGYAYLSCENYDKDCRTNRTRNYYKCGYLGSGTINPLQNGLTTSRVVRLFSGAPPTSPFWIGRLPAFLILLKTILSVSSAIQHV